MPAQCAYKSPQSWAVHRLCGYIFSLGSVLHVYSPFPKPDGWALPWIPLRFGLYTTHESWIAFDAWWLRIRNCYSMAAHGVDPHFPWQFLDRRAPQHDVSSMLEATISTYTAHAPTVLAAYACLAEVSRAVTLDGVSREDGIGRLRRIRLLRGQIWPDYIDPMQTQPVHTLDMQAIHEQHLAFFLWSPTRPYSEAFARDVAAHLLELRCRILQYQFSNARLPILKAYERTLTDYIYHHPFYEVNIGRRMVQHISLPEEIVNESVQQLLLVSREFFQNVDAAYESWFTLRSEQSKDRIVILKRFLEAQASLLDRSLQSTGVHDTIFASIFHEITIKLDKAAQNDFLFFAATHFLFEFFSRRTSDFSIRHWDLFGAPLRSLARYEARLQLEHHPWTREESDLWVHSSMGKLFDRYRIGMWAVLLATYPAREEASQPPPSQKWQMVSSVFASNAHSIADIPPLIM